MKFNDNKIITNNLAINIDLTNEKSWNLNTGLTVTSLNKWKNAVSDNIELYDFGLTAFDVGLINEMYSGIKIEPKNNIFSMNRIGFNEVHNPTTGETSGTTIHTKYNNYNISAITSNESGNYFYLNGGYLNGFFKLDGYNYELFPNRYGDGITIETLLNIFPESEGIFYLMGVRAEDKYNPYFSGETIMGNTTIGVNTSLNNYLNNIEEKWERKKAFRIPEESKEIVYSELQLNESIKNNIIAFEITKDKKIGYKLINDYGLIENNTSEHQLTTTGFTLISITFNPYKKIKINDNLNSKPLKKGILNIFVNGRSIWKINDFPEIYFKAINNDKEKQIGTSYNISWGGGSFGLKHSYHYDYQTYNLYSNQDNSYINDMFSIQNDPILDEEETEINGIVLSVEEINENQEENLVNVLRIDYTGESNTNNYFIKYNNPISSISNRDYVFNLSINNTGIFKNYGDNKISIIVYSYDTEINVIDELIYKFPLRKSDFTDPRMLGLEPFADRREYQYMKDGIMYYGRTGLPVTSMFDYKKDVPLETKILTGENVWRKLEYVIRIPDNLGQKFIYSGILIESSEELNTTNPLYIKHFKYIASDILVKDERKSNLLIEQNFNSSFIGGIQKLRLYDSALSNSEILHNAVIESKTNPTIISNKGGRLF